MNLLNSVLLLINILLSVSGQLSIKYGINVINTQETKLLLMNAIKSPYIILGIMSYGIAMILWIVILSRIDISSAYPTLSLGYILILIFSWRYLGEEITIAKVIGILLVILGVILIFRNS